MRFQIVHQRSSEDSISIASYRKMGVWYWTYFHSWAVEYTDDRGNTVNDADLFFLLLIKTFWQTGTKLTRILHSFLYDFLSSHQGWRSMAWSRRIQADTDEVWCNKDIFNNGKRYVLCPFGVYCRLMENRKVVLWMKNVLLYIHKIRLLARTLPLLDSLISENLKYISIFSWTIFWRH